MFGNTKLPCLVGTRSPERAIKLLRWRWKVGRKLGLNEISKAIKTSFQLNVEILLSLNMLSQSNEELLHSDVQIVHRALESCDTTGHGRIVTAHRLWQRIRALTR